MNLDELKETKEKCQEALAQLQRLQGEESQLLQEKERLVARLKEKGFESKADLEKELAKLADEITKLHGKLNNDLNELDKLNGSN